MEYVAISATLSKVLAAGKTFLMGKASKDADNKELKVVINVCIDSFHHGDDSLKVALRELDYTGEANAPKKIGKTIPIKMTRITSTELNSYLKVMNKNEAAAKATAGENIYVTHGFSRSTEESVKAVSITMAFVED